MNDTSLKALEVLVGTWQITGDATGTVTYRLNGDYFMTSEFSADRRSYAGAWHWPGGGYTFVGTKID